MDSWWGQGQEVWTHSWREQRREPERVLEGERERESGLV